MYSKAATRIENYYRMFGCGGFEGKCLVCGDAFSSSREAKYCSSRCVNDAAIAVRKAKADAKREAVKTCIVCSQPIEQSPSAKVKLYCGAACKQRAYRAKQVDKIAT